MRGLRPGVNEGQRKDFPRLPAREEVDFRSVPATQLESCFYYEYARENQPIVECVTRWRKQFGPPEKAWESACSWSANKRGPNGEKFCEALEELMLLVGKHFFVETAAFLLRRNCFPTTPWQRLRPKDVRLWQHCLGLYVAIDRDAGGFRTIELNMMNLWPFYKARFNTWNRSEVEVLAAELDWRGGVEKIIREFSRWARAHTKNWLKKKSRRTYQEALKQLGVLRLYDRLKNWPAVKKYMSSQGLPNYGRIDIDDTTALCRAGLAARKRKIFPIDIVTVKCGVPTTHRFTMRDEDVAKFIKRFPQYIMAYEYRERVSNRKG
jgi:hypothetical protein